MTPFNPLPPIIGFVGLAGSGKTTAANWILRNHNQAIRLSFAQPLKGMMYELIRASIPKNWPHSARDYLEDPILKETPIPFMGNLTARFMMQTLGTEWGRNALHADFWVGIAAAKLERLMGSSFKKADSVPIKAVFDDVRFANEAHMIRMYGGKLARILRPGAEKDASISTHPSEKLDFDVDVVLTNDGTLAELEQKMTALLPPASKQTKKGT